MEHRTGRGTFRLYGAVAEIDNGDVVDLGGSAPITRRGRS
jgi:hypothetical protein